MMMEVEEAALLSSNNIDVASAMVPDILVPFAKELPLSEPMSDQMIVGICQAVNKVDSDALP